MFELVRVDAEARGWAAQISNTKNCTYSLLECYSDSCPPQEKEVWVLPAGPSPRSSCVCEAVVPRALGPTGPLMKEA